MSPQTPAKIYPHLVMLLTGVGEIMMGKAQRKN